MADLYVASANQAPAPSVLTKRQNPLSAYLFNPSQVCFDLQEPEEKIILLLRRHWITNVPWLFLALLLFLAPLTLRAFPIIEFLPERYQFISVLMWYLLLTAFIFEKFLTWFFNVYLVTDKRVIDVDFTNLVYKQITEAKNERIQDTTYTIGGVIRSLFNYGDVLIQTAGAEPNLEFEAVPNPERVIRLLNELRKGQGGLK